MTLWPDRTAREDLPQRVRVDLIAANGLVTGRVYRGSPMQIRGLKQALEHVICCARVAVLVQMQRYELAQILVYSWLRAQ